MKSIVTMIGSMNIVCSFMRKQRFCLIAVFLLTSVGYAQEQPRRRGDLGVVVKQPADKKIAGVEVAMIQMHASAYQSNLRAGDIISHVNDRPLHSVADFVRMTSRPRSGDVFSFKINRKGQSQTVSVPIVAVPMEQSGAEIKAEYDWLKMDDGSAIRVVTTWPAQGAGPWPTMLILPGLGGTACDDSAFVVYRQMAHEFCRRGYRVIRWDQRGSGDSYGQPYSEVDFDTEVSDAITVLKSVLTQSETDRSRIYAFGFGVGGVLGAHLTARQEGLAGLITWGVLSRSLVEFMIDSARLQGRLANLGAPEIDRQVRLIVRFYDRMLGGDEPAELIKKFPQLKTFVDSAGRVQSKSASYWRQLDATLYWKLYGQGKVPILALQADYDCMSPVADQTNLLALVAAAGRKDVHAVSIPDCDHYMNAVTSQEEAFKKLTTREYQFSSAGVEATVKWIRKLEEWRASGSPQPMPQDAP